MVLIKKNKQWQWCAWGKHPGMEDFVWAGTQTPLFKRFTKWVDNGFARLSAGSTLRLQHCSWRFWTKGTGDQVVCGLVRNSCDTHGRSFPLLCIGAGALEHWANNCSMLPFAFESVWKGFEYTASARFETIRQLNDSLQVIQQPAPNWRTYQQRIYDAADLTTTSKNAAAVDGEKRVMKIDCQVPENLPYDDQFCRHVMAMGDAGSPLAVFIGEIDETVAVAVINSTLTPADFGWLWALDKKRMPAMHTPADKRMRWQLI